MVLKFYFPKRNEIRHVLISKCLACFTKPQICNIVSRAKAWAVEKDIDLVRLQMPHFARNFIYCGVGAALHEATTTERDPAAALSGPIYHNPQYQQTLQEPDQALADANPRTRPFFPDCPYRFNASANDCLAKAINTCLGLPFFTHREQLVRLIDQVSSMSS
jgi:hypothetical protein